MNDNFSIRINLSDNEFEIKGSEEFIKNYYDKAYNLIKDFQPAENSQEKPAGATENASHVQQGLFLNSDSNSNLESESEEFFNAISKASSNTDKVLVAGYFLQLKLNSFTTKEVKEFLLEYGVKVENPSQLIKNSINTHKIIQIGKGKYKLSQHGLKYVTSNCKIFNV